MSCIHVNDGHIGNCSGHHAHDGVPSGLHTLRTPTNTLQAPRNTLQTPTSTVQSSSPKSYIPPTAYIEIIPQPYGYLRVTMSEAERLLKLYQDEYHPRFPFVPVPRNTTAQDLFQRQPFLFRTIIQIVAPQNAAAQRAFTTWFREYIATHIVVKQEKRLDLLQAILLFIAWSESHYYAESWVTNLHQLAVGLMVDLGLNSHKPSKHVGNGANQFEEDAKRLNGFRSRPPHTLEDMRTYLGCFYISSLAAALFRHIPMMPTSSYISVCCDRIEAEQEYSEDTYLVVLIRMQRIVCRILVVFPAPDSDDNGSATLSPAANMAMTTLRTDLENLKLHAPKDIQDNLAFKIAFNGNLARLYEPAIYIASSTSSLDSIRKSEAMWCCLEFVKETLHAYASTPVADLSYLPFNTYCHMTFALITATRLTILQDPDWNSKFAGESLDFATIMQRLSDVCDQADNIAIAQEWRRKRKYVTDTLSVMSMHRDKLRWIRSWYLSKVAASNPTATENHSGAHHHSDSQYQVQTVPAPRAITDPGNPMAVEALSPVSFLGDEWWQAMMDDMSFLQP